MEVDTSGLTQREKDQDYCLCSQEQDKQVQYFLKVKWKQRILKIQNVTKNSINKLSKRIEYLSDLRIRF